MQKTDKYRAFIGEARSDLKAALRQGLEYIGWDKLVNSHSRVYLKPNFTYHQYREGVTTSPLVLRSLLELLKTRAGNITVVESDGGNNSFKAEDAFEGHGMYKMCKELDIELLNLSRLPSKLIDSKINGKNVQVRLPEILLEDNVDCFISVPVLKVHIITGVSLSIKNLWGCYPDTMRCLYHKDLDRKLALLTKMLNPRIVVLDGTYALNRHGPMYGEPVEMGLVMVSNNPVAADSLAASLIGIPLRRCGHILVAERAGLGTADLNKIETSCDYRKYKKKFSIEKTIIDKVSTIFFFRPALAKIVMSSVFTPLIYWIAEKFRTREEKKLVEEINEQKKVSPYC